MFGAFMCEGQDSVAFTWGIMISVHSCVRGRISVLLPEEWQFWFICVWGVRFRCIYLKDDDYGAFMCEGYDSSVFTWGMMISVHSCVRCRILVHLPEEWRFALHSCVRDKIPVHLLDGWWFRCIHVWGVGYRCIYLGRDDCDAFMCEGQDSGAFTWGIMISVHSCVCGRISVPLPEEWRFRCIDVWGVGFRCIYLRDDDVGAFMCEG